MRSVRDIPHLENIPVLVRAALNVPIATDGKVLDDFRLRSAVPTLRFLSERGARVIVVSHIGEAGTETLREVAEALGKLLPRVSFFHETVGARVREAVRNLAPGDILVLENVRRSRGEKMNDPVFAHELAALADIFVEDSFDTCHRMHASIVSVPKLLPSYAGLELEREVYELRAALTPKSSSLAVIGGAKFNTKEPVLTKLLEKYDRVFVGGALADDFLKASGDEVGKSLVSPEDNMSIRKMLGNKKLLLPIDLLVIPANVALTPAARSHARVARADDIHTDEIILDQGPGTDALIAEIAKKSKTILWNGPLGNYENGFTDGTESFARAVANSDARSVIGGGDTVAAIDRLGLLSKFSFVSTGGGAMLDFLANGSLPGIEVLG